MSGDPLNLTGQWDGTFRYPNEALPTTPFLAEISENAGVFSGVIMEPDLHKSGQARSSINGHRAGSSVDFTKVYHARESGYKNPVDYVGQLSADGLSITGIWSLQNMDGTFEMHREAQAVVLEEAEAEIAEPIER